MPGWLAFRVHVPADKMVTTCPLSEQTEGVMTAVVTGNPDVAVMLIVTVDAANVISGGIVILIVCDACVMLKERVTVGAG